ncbi:MAG: hypothetical protein RL757_2467 [Bacteroidota bacterium]|jgi:transcription antitermination factor NusG
MSQNSEKKGAKIGISDSEYRWFAVRTKFRHEKALALQLEKTGVQAYVPMRMVVRKYVRKKREIELPLIHSFVFVRIVMAQYQKVLKCEYVAGFLKFGNDILPIPEEEMDFLEQVCNPEIEVEIDTKKLRTGLKVEIVEGVFTGQNGILVEIKGRKWMQIELFNFGQTILINVEKDKLKVLE